MNAARNDTIVVRTSAGGDRGGADAAAAGPAARRERLVVPADHRAPTTAQDAIPGMRIPVYFTPTKEGRYQINCAQLCGNGHSTMSQGYIIVESQAEFDKWLASKQGAATNFE